MKRGRRLKMGKIVVLAGSPRKDGNTDRLVAAFTKGAEKNNTVEVISISDHRVNPCTGCNSCFEREGNRCFQNDDMTEIYEKLNEADTLIIASPVYFYGISAQLKAVIDRLHNPMRSRFNIKKLGLILVGAAELPELFDAIITQYRLVLRFFKLEDAGMVLIRGARERGEVKDEDLAQAFQLGESITDQDNKKGSIQEGNG
jgi:NAD(P)H-dependent FMN reductase